MQTTQSDEMPAIKLCGRCQDPIKAGDEHQYLSQVLCEDCYMDARMPRVRKTHWQYIHCIKTQYLREAYKD